MSFKIKNWAKFQHFKDRKPPWVKLYRDLLDDMEWHRLDAKAAKALVMFWLIASENEGELPDTETLAFRLRTTDAEIKTVLSKLSHWLEQDDITAISTRYQSDGLETETETEERQREKRASRIPPNFEPTPEPEAEAGIDRRIELANFRDYWTAKSGAQATKLDWQATWRQWARKANRPGVNPFKPAPNITVPVNHDIERTRQMLDADKAIPRHGPSLEVLAQMAKLRGVAA